MISRSTSSCKARDKRLKTGQAQTCLCSNRGPGVPSRCREPGSWLCPNGPAPVPGCQQAEPTSRPGRDLAEQQRRPLQRGGGKRVRCWGTQGRHTAAPCPLPARRERPLQGTHGCSDGTKVLWRQGQSPAGTAGRTKGPPALNNLPQPRGERGDLPAPKHSPGRGREQRKHRGTYKEARL